MEEEEEKQPSETVFPLHRAKLCEVFLFHQQPRKGGKIGNRTMCLGKEGKGRNGDEGNSDKEKEGR